MEVQHVSSLEADVEELEQILHCAKRSRVREELQRLIGKTEAQISLAKATTVAPALSETTNKTEAEISSKKATTGTHAPSDTTKTTESEISLAKAMTGTPAPSKTTKSPALSKYEAPEGCSIPKPEKRPVEIPVAAGPWTEITTFALDLGGYSGSTITVDIRMKGVETLPTENITCDFTESSFDLKVMGYEGKNHRMIKTPLEKDIIPSSCKMKVKKNHIIITLEKVKGEHSYDSWSDLCAKGGRRKPPAKKGDNPQDSIMGMMEDLYDDGDDNMKKIIGEAMYKAQRGEKYDPKDSKLGALDGMDDL